MKLKQMVVRAFACTAAAVVLLGEAWAGAGSDAIRKFGLVGT
jgi:hypothetical protein